MSRRLQLAACLLALGLCAVAALPAEAQNRPPKNRQQPQQQPHQQRQPQPQQQRQQQPQQPHRDAGRNANPNRPPASTESVAPNTNRPPERARNQQNRPPSAYTPPPRNFNNLNPQEKQRTLENNKDFEKRTPAEKERIRIAQQNWAQLTPEQKNHIKNDVMPKWRQLPVNRQRAIGSRLNVLQNMPESARNQHLNDPNFTRDMSEEDKAMLRDLSHLHVGGAPDAPPNE
jgi:hypothetical protein